jgi:GrpB-like predicted nucleotidyltransferase (UPF0157 family)
VGENNGMATDLESMSLAELGNLFPIIIGEHDPLWHDLYLSEKDLIERAIGQNNIVRISHYGSTAVANLHSKPTIDILLEVVRDINTDSLIASLKGMGYRYSPQPDNPAPHMMFMKGYTPEGFNGQAYHVHVRYSGDWDELYFRDYLLTHPRVAKEYGRLKIELKDKYEHDREAYTKGKTKFIQRTTEQARRELGNKYQPVDSN